MQKKVYMVVGCPGSGKSWVCNQIKDHFTFVHHDAYIGMEGGTYVKEILKEAQTAKKPLLIEAPFSISQIADPLKAQGFNIHYAFIQEHPLTISTRYLDREKKKIPQGHLTRQETYLKRAKELGAFHGTSRQVMDHLLKEIGEKEHE